MEAGASVRLHNSSGTGAPKIFTVTILFKAVLA